MATGKKPATRIVHQGRRSAEYHGVVNPPVFHASTILFPTLEALKSASPYPHGSDYYGRHGTPTRFLLEEAIADLEGGYGTLCTASGYGAVAQAILAFVKPGDHVLITDSAYEPTRNFANVFLKRFGITAEFYAPTLGADIAALLRDTTTVVLCESPGSLTFEMQDLPAIAEAAHRRGAKVLLDNTWASPILCQPFALGVDVSIQAATKYIVGHADAMMGAITTATQTDFKRVKRQLALLGDAVAPDDCYLALRGLRTLAVRLERHQATGLKLAQWLAGRPEVRRVLHPALPEDPGHAIWKRDFCGASGLFSIVLDPAPEAAIAALVDHLELFGMGYSWGGFESLILPANPKPLRSATSWTEDGQLLRIHAGLEDADDLIDDLAAGLARYNAAR